LQQEQLEIHFLFLKNLKTFKGIEEMLKSSEMKGKDPEKGEKKQIKK
jgi:hypothetical protein